MISFFKIVPYFIQLPKKPADLMRPYFQEQAGKFFAANPHVTLKDLHEISQNAQNLAKWAQHLANKGYKPAFPMANATVDLKAFITWLISHMPHEPK